MSQEQETHGGGYSWRPGGWRASVRQCLGSRWFRRGVLLAIAVLGILLKIYVGSFVVSLTGEQELNTWTFCIAFIAFGWAIATLYHGEKALDEFEHISRHISTSSAGPFPDHLEAIAELIRNTEVGSKIDIMADCADYGSFFNPELHRRVMGELLDACCKRRVTLRWLVSGPPNPLTMAAGSRPRNFPKILKHYLSVLRNEQPFLEWFRDIRESPEARRKIVEFMKNVRAIDIDDAKLVEYITTFLSILLRETRFIFNESKHDLMLRVLLMLRQWYFIRELEGIHATIRSLRDREPMIFMWLRDHEREAVFMVVDPNRHQRNAAVRTRDRELARSLRLLFDAEWRKSGRLTSA